MRTSFAKGAGPANNLPTVRSIKITRRRAAVNRHRVKGAAVNRHRVKRAAVNRHSNHPDTQVSGQQGCQQAELVIIDDDAGESTKSIDHPEVRATQIHILELGP